jgi:tetratricopeptide (TPR) repeat protein
MKKTVACGLCFLLILTLTTTGSSAATMPDCRADLDSGDVLYAKYNNTAAYAFYARALRSCPSYEPLMKTTRALDDMGEDIRGKKGAAYFRQAMDLADSMQRRYPDSLQSYFLMALAAGSLAQYWSMGTKVRLARTVLSNAKKAVAIDSAYSPAHVVLGAYYREVATANGVAKVLAKALYGGVPNGTLEDSYRELTLAVKFDSQNIFAYFELAKTYHAMGREADARRQLRLLGTLPDDDHEAWRMKRDARELLKYW